MAFSTSSALSDAERHLQRLCVADAAPLNRNHDDPGSGEHHLVEKWKPTTNAMTEATRNAFASSPQGTLGAEPSRADFRQYRHGVFTQLLAAVASDPDIPAHLTSPPVARFAVKFLDQPDAVRCPCCFSGIRSSILLENEQGVTKTDLVKGVRDFLYGEAAPPVFYVDAKAGRESETTSMETALVHTVDWITTAHSQRGEWVSFYSEMPQISMYCCPSGMFKEAVEREERDREERGKWEANGEDVDIDETMDMDEDVDMG
jgi:hypothetical protein